MEITRLDNFVTQSKARVMAKKNTPPDEFMPVLDRAKEVLSRTGSTSSKANLNGIVIELTTNSKHQMDFWSENWWKAEETAEPHAKIFSVNGVEGLEPSSYYCPPIHTALFVNTEYYGQCKSWALGMAAAILEKNFSTLSIHGATAMFKGKGVVIIAPTGTGKTTHSFRIFMNKDGKICGDDWAYVSYPKNVPKFASAPLMARQPE